MREGERTDKAETCENPPLPWSSGENREDFLWSEVLEAAEKIMLKSSFI